MQLRCSSLGNKDGAVKIIRENWRRSCIQLERMHGERAERPQVSVH